MSISIGGENRFSSFGVLAEIRNPSNQFVPLRNKYNQEAMFNFCAVHTTCETSLPLAVSGPYTIRITEFLQNATGTYSLTLDAVGPTWNGGSNAPPSPVCGVVADGARTIACGETVVGNFDVYADADTYTFFADTGDVVAFSVSGCIVNGVEQEPGVIPVGHIANQLEVVYCSETVGRHSHTNEACSSGEFAGKIIVVKYTCGEQIDFPHDDTLFAECQPGTAVSLMVQLCYQYLIAWLKDPAERV
jgi:hypothetical protein